MKIAVLLALFLPQEETPVQKAAKKLGEAKSYGFQLLIQKQKEKVTLTGLYVKEGEAIYVESDKGALYRDGERVWAREGKGEWKEVTPKEASGRRPLRDKRKKDSPDPHELAAKLADLTPSLKKERSDKLYGKTVDVYVNNLPKEQARKALESNGRGFGAASLDFTPTDTGLMFYVGRTDGMLYRVEQVYSVGVSGREEDDVKIHVDYFDIGKAKIPAELKKLAGE